MSGSVESIAARTLADAGLSILDVSPAGLVVDLGTRQADVGLGLLRRIIALAPADSRDAQVAAWTDGVLASLAGSVPLGDIRQRLVPRLLAHADPRLFTTALAPGLHLALAEDLPLRQRFLTPFDLPRLGLSMSDARAVAIANLQAATPPPVRAEGVWSWELGDGLDAARLLLAGSWPDGAAGALVAAPTRDHCWWVGVQGAQDIEGGVRLGLRARSLLASSPAPPYPLSPTLWWVPAGLGDIAPVPLSVSEGAVRVGVPDDLARSLG